MKSKVSKDLSLEPGFSDMLSFSKLTIERDLLFKGYFGYGIFFLGHSFSFDWSNQVDTLKIRVFIVNTNVNS